MFYFIAGLAVMAVMLVTTCLRRLTSLVIILCWHKPPIIALLFLLFFGSIELLYFMASLVIFREGAWLPILLALILVTIMFIWHYTTIKKYQYDLHNKLSLEWLLALGPTLGICRVPGIRVVFTDLTSGIPANLSRFVTNLPAFYRVLAFVCVKFVLVLLVPLAERYLLGRAGPASLRAYRCIVRYRYRDVHHNVDSFESDLVQRLADFVRYDWSWTPTSTDRGNEDPASGSDRSLGEHRLAVVGNTGFTTRSGFEMKENTQQASVSLGFQTVESIGDIVEMNTPNERRVRFAVKDTDTRTDFHMRQELEDLKSAKQSGTAFILGHSHVKAKQESSILKRLAVNFGYNILRRNCRGPDVVLKVPPASSLEVGMVYVV